MPTKRFVVSGHVQGVFFRASAKAEAQRLGLRGYARNLPDGRVEVLVDGESAAVAALERWLWQGPPQATVTSVVEQPPLEKSPPNGFEIR